MTVAARPLPTSAYVHFPYCLNKCPYCDFASRKVDRPEIPHARYADAALAELERRAHATAGRHLVSVFFGGGTPSLWEPSELGRVLAGIRGAFTTAEAELEVTVECNPSSLDRARAAALRAVGVDRLSIGVQSLSDERLRFLGRHHDARGGLAAVRDALAEVPRVSVDVMFGMRGQRPAEAAAELDRLLDLGVRHVSAYALTIEPGTPFGELHRKGRLAIAPDDAYAELFVQAEETLEARGLRHYEVSNYAVAGQEARHNLHYWRGLPYLGLGAGAVGCLEGPDGRARRWRNDADPERYLREAGSPAVEVFEEALGGVELVREALMLGLRTREGVDLEALRARTGVDPLAGREGAVLRREARGDVVREGGFLRVPRERWLRLDGIVADLF